MTIASQADDRLLIPGPVARHMLGDIGNTKYCELLNNGDLERVNIGRRSFVTAESLHSYVERLRAAPIAQSVEEQQDSEYEQFTEDDSETAVDERTGAGSERNYGNLSPPRSERTRRHP